MREYKRAVEAWAREQTAQAPPLADRLKPRADAGKALAELGGAQILAGDAAGALATLDAAAKADPENARAFYLRAGAREALAQTDAAIADYSLAGRVAFANSSNLASGEAHLYRGIALYLPCTIRPRA